MRSVVINEMSISPCQGGRIGIHEKAGTHVTPNIVDEHPDRPELLRCVQYFGRRIRVQHVRAHERNRLCTPLLRLQHEAVARLLVSAHGD